MMEQCKEKLSIAMFGQKRIPSREGGVEIVVEELCTRMVLTHSLLILMEMLCHVMEQKIKRLLLCLYIMCQNI